MAFPVLRAAIVGLLAFALNVSGAQAERPIVDLHRLDADFELFAGDSNVPWKPATVRLDTYSSAPVAVSVYAVDPTDVLTVGPNFDSRAISTAGRHPVVAFTFTPPGGYQFQSNQVALPLETREGFFVVEARRGDVGEQVWINRSRVGFFSKQTPGELLFYGVDVGTGLPLAHMRAQFVVNHAFETEQTDAAGMLHWSRSPRPVFALAQWGNSYAFSVPLPQAPIPSEIVGVRTDSAVVHAGETVRVVGFVRARSDGALRAGAGSALVTLRAGAREIAQRRVEIDGAGAFSAALPVPAVAAAGEYTVLAQTHGGIGGASVHVDADAGDLSLRVRSGCTGTCDFRDDVPLLVHASRPNITVHLTVVRSPHAYVDYTPAAEPWATTKWLDGTVALDDRGDATVRIPHPSDDLSSTYGVRVTSGGATAQTRIVVPTASAVIRLQVDGVEQSLGTPLDFDVYARELDGTPLAATPATVSLAHGSSVAQQQLMLDGDGHARGSFTAPQLGTDLLLASLNRDGRAVDAIQIHVDPQAVSAATDGRSPEVRIVVDQGAHRAGDELSVEADAPGAQGDALITFESALGVEYKVVACSDGRAVAHLRAVDAPGDLRVGAAFVHDGAIEWSTVPVALDAPGRPHYQGLALQPQRFLSGAAAHVAFDRDAAAGTYVVRVSRGVPSGSAIFSSAPELLAIGLTTTQNSAPPSVTWHPGVYSTGAHPQALGFVRRGEPPADESLVAADTQPVVWKVTHGGAGGAAFALPESAGTYELSVLDISDDGSVIAGASRIEVH